MTDSEINRRTLPFNANREFKLYYGVKASQSGTAPNDNKLARPGARLFLNEYSGLTFSYKHTYMKPLDEAINKTNNTGSKLLELLNQGHAIKEALDPNPKASTPSRIMSKYQQLPAYEETETIKLPSTLSFSFAYGQEGKFDAKFEVVRPILYLAALFAPIASGGTMLGGPLPLSADVLVNVVAEMLKPADGAEEGDVLPWASGSEEAADDEEASNGILSRAFQMAGKIIETFDTVAGGVLYNGGNTTTAKAVCSGKLGPLLFPAFVVKGVSWDFDFSQVDANGWPYRGTLHLNDCETVKVATYQVIKNMQSGVNLQPGVIFTPQQIAASRKAAGV